MEQLQCKVCGGTMSGGRGTVASCPHCGNRQTLPRLNNPSHARFFWLVNELRRSKKFDQAIATCHQILSEDPHNAEAYWLLALCHYEVEYIRDVRTQKFIVVVRNPQKKPFTQDENYRAALQYADNLQRAVYVQEAQIIDDKGKTAAKKIKGHNMRGWKLAFFAVTFLALLCALVLGVFQRKYAAIPQREYDAAVALMKEGRYQDAIDAFKALDGYEGICNQIAQCNNLLQEETYNQALAMLDDGNVIGAYEAWISLDGYKDSGKQAGAIFDRYKTEKLKQVKAGDEIYLGTYEQNHTLTEKEPLQWLVLEVEDGKALVISKYALASKSYHASHTGAAWEDCTLHKWLNGDFWNAAFTDEEKAMITAGATSDDGTTRDPVFLLTIDEADEYFRTVGERACTATAQAKAEGTYFYTDTQTCWWWLKSEEDIPGYVAFVDGLGNIRPQGNRCDYGSGGVRPVMWIELIPTTND